MKMSHDIKNSPPGTRIIEPDSDDVPSAAEAHEPWWRRLTNMIWGYDFFVSYNWASGGQYAVGLAERLRERGYDCFLDQSEFAAGDDWKSEAQKALSNTRRLVIIATREAMVKSEAVRHEINVFTRRSRRVIPIVFGERFSEDEQHHLPTLKQIPEATIDLVEEMDRLDKGPSETILTKLIQAHRLVRRRSVRVMIVAAALSILATAAGVASIFWAQAVMAKNEEVKQRQVAESAKLINRADLLRETNGPKLEESLNLARAAYDFAERAGISPDDARRAIQQAKALMPLKIGAPWHPFGKQVPFRLRAIKNRIVFLRESYQNDEPYALVAELDNATKKWRVVLRLSNKTHGKLAADEYGREIITPDNPRWILTCRTGQVIVWDILSGKQAAQLPIEHAPKDRDGQELLAISTNAAHAVVRNGRELAIWNLAQRSPDPLTLPMEYHLARYAISPSGDMLAWARQNEFGVITTKDANRVRYYPITGGGGHAESLQFIESSTVSIDRAVFAAWSANQTMAMSSMARKDAPNHQAGIWYLGEGGFWAERDGDRQTPPDLRQVRANQFDVVFSTATDQPSLAILDPENAVQWLDLESQISFTLGGTAGPGIKARFSGHDILIVHTDGTARLWNLDSRQELLRFTAKDSAIVDTTFLTVRSENKPKARAVVTVDKMGVVQGWTSLRDPDQTKTK